MKIYCKKEMNWQENNIIKFLLLISFPVFLFSCQGTVKSHQIANVLESKEDNYEQAISKSCLWLDKHPASFSEGGALPILEEIIAFYVLMHNTEDMPQKNNYFHQIQKRINLLASNKDYPVKQKEYTVFLTVATIAEKLGIHTVDFKKIIEEQLIPSPLLYTESITSTVWITVYLARLGYTPALDLDSLLPHTNLHEELNRKLLFKHVNSEVNPMYINPMIMTAYFMAHEIFALTDWGELPSPPIVENNRTYFSKLFDKTIQWAITINQIDILGELIICVKMLDLKDVPSLEQGIEFILSHQEDNGTFGITNPSLPNIYRHGILVSMMALSML